MTPASDSSKILKLHIGCGPRVLKGWINIDLKFRPYLERLKFYTPEVMRGDQSDFRAIDVARTPLPFADNSVDVIFHEDFIEHLSQRGQILFLADALRVLKPGAVHRVNTPNLLVSMRGHSDFMRGFKGVYVGEWDKWHHRNLLTPSSLEELALMVGYSEIVFTGRDQSSSRLVPIESRPASDRPKDGNILADLIK